MYVWIIWLKNKNSIKDFKVIINPDLKLSPKSPIDFRIDSHLSKLLGFWDKNLIIKVNKTVSAEKLPKLRPFDIIEIQYNLVKSSITNHTLDIHKHNEINIIFFFC